MFRFAAAVSTQPDPQAAVGEACHTLANRLETTPSLVVAFVSAEYQTDIGWAGRQILSELRPAVLAGCLAESVLANGREVEGRPAVALWGASLPGVRVLTMHLIYERTADGGAISGWHDVLPATWPAEAGLLVLGDPFSFPAERLLQRVNEDHPGIPVVGGMASGVGSPGTPALLLGADALQQGAVAVYIEGPLRMQAVVSQGCRPIGRPFVVTRAERNVILELAGASPLERLRELYESLPPSEQALVRRGVHVGLVTNEYRERFDRGDFLVRNCLGADEQSGALAIGEYVRAGQTVQFHVRDAQTADEDLRQLLAAAQQSEAAAPQATLLFTCNGRGTRLFDTPDHDAAVLHELLGGIPVAGFFAQGELGPIGGKNFLHGYTASAVLFRGLQSG
ncbi:MAG: FIST C-terminal domain-containing protein [Pirellulales bacterium]|nr:FIST C-terminal domain-containing protein [Pirellulales bacterium]